MLSLQKYLSDQQKPLRYRAWRAFFQEEEYPIADTTEDVLNVFINILPDKVADIEPVFSNSELIIDCKELEASLLCYNLTVRSLFNQSSERQLRVASVALTIVCNEILVSRHGNDLSSHITPIRKIYLRITNVTPQIVFNDIKVKNIGRLISINGTLSKISNIRPEMELTTYICTRCQRECIVYSQGPATEFPGSCQTIRCTSKVFQISNPQSVVKYRAVQDITIQEMMEGDDTGGRVPRSLNCILIDFQNTKVVPGDTVKISGVIESKTAGCSYQKDTVQELRIRVNSIRSHYNNDDREDADEKFTEEELDAIKNLSKKENLCALLVNSLCPSIYGSELVKFGILLSLFGGSRRKVNNETFTTRSESHVLMIGDPGIGKSQLLTAASNIAPRSVYVTGNGASVAGLTVAIRNNGSGEYAIEAGALVLADKGACFIDEFDKMSEDRHEGLLEAMEQQSVSIAKAGLACTLPAKTAIIAAANPTKGDYGSIKRTKDVLKLNNALLSRFDIVFFMKDKSSKQRDIKLSDHIIEKRLGNNTKRRFSDGLTQKNEECGTIISRIKKRIDPIPGTLLKKFIAYSRQKINPIMTEEAEDIIKESFLRMRSKRKYGSLLPVTIRQLESLIRLAEARAKMDLRSEISEQDALDVVELIESCYEDSFIQGIETEESGKKITKTKKRQRIITILRHEFSKGRKDYTREDIISISGTEVDIANETIDMLMECGVLLMKAGGRLVFCENNI
eukprot:GHVP01052707.1.p1 GENE.GHVP01052707.1~~GHVP01052707.1.p1  ORF type:complete len:739 (-),score=125.56 GHVP01052707.1:50-2266(-)